MQAEVEGALEARLAFANGQQAAIDTGGGAAQGTDLPDLLRADQARATALSTQLDATARPRPPRIEPGEETSPAMRCTASTCASRASSAARASGRIEERARAEARARSGDRSDQRRDPPGGRGRFARRRAVPPGQRKSIGRSRGMTGRMNSSVGVRSEREAAQRTGLALREGSRCSPPSSRSPRPLPPLPPSPPTPTSSPPPSAPSSKPPSPSSAAPTARPPPTAVPARGRR